MGEFPLENFSTKPNAEAEANQEQNHLQTNFI